MARRCDATVVPPPPGHIAGAGDLEALAESMTLELGVRGRGKLAIISVRPASIGLWSYWGSGGGGIIATLKRYLPPQPGAAGAWGSLLPSSLGSIRRPFLLRRDHDRVSLGKSRGKSEISPKEPSRQAGDERKCCRRPSEAMSWSRTPPRDGSTALLRVPLPAPQRHWRGAGGALHSGPIRAASGFRKRGRDAEDHQTSLPRVAGDGATRPPGNQGEGGP